MLKTQASDSTAPAKREKRHVGWFVASRRVEVASVRYRCFHMVQALEQRGITNSIYTEESGVYRDFSRLDALVVVKRLGDELVKLVVSANDHRIPVFLDLCDDLLSAEYRPKLLDLYRAVFRAIAPRLDGIITTGVAMSERICSYGIPLPPIFEIPDIAETPEILSSVESFASKLSSENARVNIGEIEVAVQSRQETPIGLGSQVLQKFRGITGKPSVSSGVIPKMENGGADKQIIWFGNHGGAHSNFGMLSLIAVTPALRAVYKKIPFELVVVSNHIKKFESFLARIGVPVRYVSWSTENAYRELAKSDVALLTSGDDEFCQVKSANRTLQALVTGVPVVAPSSPALQVLSECIIQNDIEAGLITYLSDPKAAADAIAKSKSIIESKYSLEAVGSKWTEILDRFPISNIQRPFQKRTGERSRTLILINTKRDLNSLKSIISKLRRRGVTVMIMVTENAGRESSAVFEYLAAENIIPTFAEMDELEAGDARWLRSADAVVLAAESSNERHQVAHALAKLARTHGVPVILTELGAEVPRFFETKPVPAVTFNSSVFFTKRDPDELPAWVPADLRARCVFLPPAIEDGQLSVAASIVGLLLKLMREPV